MFDFTESIQIQARPTEVWRFIIDVERWWLESNPEHIRLEVRGPGSSIGLGTEVAFEERVAGIEGRAEGEITEWVPEARATWEGQAEYRYYGLPLRVDEGVSWRIDGEGEGTRLAARVWAEFPSHPLGRLFEWYARRVLDVIERDREHARRELEYLKAAIETAGPTDEGTR